MRGRILTVDDDPNQRELVELVLQEEGYSVSTAGNGAEALSAMDRFRPDVVLVDASMPVMNGFTLCEKLRSHPRTSAIPIIMITGLNSPFGRINSLAHGADAYLAKPYAPRDLVEVVNDMLRRSASLC